MTKGLGRAADAEGKEETSPVIESVFHGRHDNLFSRGAACASLDAHAFGPDAHDKLISCVAACASLDAHAFGRAMQI